MKRIFFKKVRGIDESSFIWDPEPPKNNWSRSRESKLHILKYFTDSYHVRS